MLPFQAPFNHRQNQIQVEASNNSAAQQVVQSNPCSTNSSNIGNNHAPQFPNSSCAYNNLSSHSQSHAPKPQCPVPSAASNTHFSNLNGNTASVPNVHFPNVSNHCLPVLNSVLGVPNGQFYPQGTFQNLNLVASSQLHGHLHNIPLNLNQIAMPQPSGQWFVSNHSQVTHQRPFQPQMCSNMPAVQFSYQNPPHHVNQITGLSHGQFTQHPTSIPQVVPFNMPLGLHPLMGGLNQGAQDLGSQNPTFLMNPQFGMWNSNEVAQNTQDQQMLGTPTMGQQLLQRNSHSSFTSGQAQVQQPQKSLQPRTCQRLQDDHTKFTGDNISNIKVRNHQSKKFTRNHRGSGKRESENPRFQTSNFRSVVNAKQNFGRFSGKGHRGQGAKKTHPTNFTRQTTGECRRPHTLSYSEQEIQEWREERRKNHPSKCKIEKKLDENQTQSEVIDSGAQKRRQQLREILAKQAELGVEVAELPPNYLSDTENLVGKREENKTWAKKGNFQNKCGKRRRNGKNNRFVKKQKLTDLGSSPVCVTSKKKPTLLRKLLSADIKRDKSGLLQAFRFMVLNSFFKDWPEKPLEFPTITVKDISRMSVVVNRSSPCHGDEVPSGITKYGKIEEFETINDQNMAVDDDANGNDGEAEETVVYGHAVETECISKEIESSEEEEGELTN